MPNQAVVEAIFRHLKTRNYIFDIGPFSTDRPNIDATDEEIEWHLRYLEQTGALTILFQSGAGAITVDRVTAIGKSMRDAIG